MTPPFRFFALASHGRDSSPRTLPIWIPCLAGFCVPVLMGICTAQNTLELKNQYITAEFDRRGLISVAGRSPKEVVHLAHDDFSISIDEDRLDSTKVEPEVKCESANTILYRYSFHGYAIDVIYALPPGWRFVTKQLKVVQAPKSTYVVNMVEPSRVEAREAIFSLFTPGTYEPQLGDPDKLSKSLSTQDFGAFLRFSNADGLMLLAQNPFLEISRHGQSVSLSYRPEMEWQSSWGPFSSDLTCLGPYKVTGRRMPSRMVREWEVPPASVSNDGADEEEIQAFADCVDTFLLHPSPKPIRVQVGWTLNDYQINVATPEGRAEYKTILDMSSDLGIQSLLYAPANSELAQAKDDVDDWHWEHVLWLGLGQEIRQGRWDPETGPLPASITEMLDYAKSKHIGLLAYVYPSLPFSQNHAWLVADPRKPGENTFSSLASRQFQDFLIQHLLAFKRRTGVAGYSFDYTFLKLPGSSSYAQWWGWRRVLEELRKHDPEIIIDGRQTYQMYGPWSWLAGSYPHPTGQDEQPESFTPYPDLHFDRVSADRTRFVNYWYRNYQFAPAEIIPGYMTHQTERYVNVSSDALRGKGSPHAEQVYTDVRDPDWDYLGYRYSVISSIGSGGWNNVMDMIPARNRDEFRHFSSDDKAWIRRWLEWTEQNAELLRHTRTILGQPAIGKTDGTSAVIGDHGYVFLFNPNYKQTVANFRLDPSIGLSAGDHFLLREIYPREGRLIGKAGAGAWRFGDDVPMLMDGTSARVLEVMPFTLPIRKPLVFGSATSNSTAVTHAGTLRLKNIAGEPGCGQQIGVLLPNAMPVKSMSVNGQDVTFRQIGAYAWSWVKFAGQKFAHSEQIKLQPENDGVLTGTFVVPKRILAQLAERREQWPIPWTKDDYAATWLVPERLLLYLQIAEPDDSLHPQITIDGRSAPFTKAYASVRVYSPTFVGFYLDLSHIEPDVEHTVELKVPALKDGQLQGLFFDNVEAEYTQVLVAERGGTR
jgi:hypothetical protein